jgi:hypothetical protein
MSYAQESKWTHLFNGKSLTGWTKLGGNAAYHVDDDAIVGTTVYGTPNTFLTTNEYYSDFILEYEVKLSEATNSGVQIRSNSNPDYRDGVVHGYQVEIDPSDRAWSGGIYDEQRRGWLYDLDEMEKAQTAYKHLEWNKFRVEAIGDTIKTWLNGVSIAHLVDGETSEGFIGLQVHSIGNPQEAGIEIRWRNFRIMTENLDVHSKISTAPIKHTSNE